MSSFKHIWARAAKQCGGAEALRASLPVALDERALPNKPDREYLSAMTRCVFQAGFAWHVVEARWPQFEQVFHAFEPATLLALDDAAWAAFKSDQRIIRNGMKIDSVRANAAMVSEVSAQAGGFGHFLATWPSDDLVGLLAFLRQHGSRLGGATGMRFLQAAGKDCFMLDPQVVTSLQHEGLGVAAQPTSKRDLASIQAAFNAWHQDSGLAYQHLGLVLAAAVAHDESSGATAALMREK